MKKYLLILSFSLISVCTIGQQKPLNIKEPKASDFIRYGNVPISEYTGTFNLNVPLFEIDVNMNHESISLNYNSQGFMPNKRDGEVGVNWTLNYGGVITRQVVGTPDEYSGEPTTGGGKPHGLYYGGRRMPEGTNIDLLNFKIFNLDWNTIYPVLSDFGGRIKPESVGLGSAYEMKSDIFHFSFHGVSGKFFFDALGKPVVIANNNQSIKVILDDFLEQSANYNCGPITNPVGGSQTSKITLVMDNGYRYVFGGTINSLSYSTNAQAGDANLDPLKSGINSWYLTEVKSPYGMPIRYEYENFSTGWNCIYQNQTPNDTPANNESPFLMNKYVNLDATLNSYSTDFGFLQASQSGSSGSVANDPIHEVTKACYLKRIYMIDSKTLQESNLFNVQFNYELNSSKFYSSDIDQYFPGNTYGKKLSQIKVYSKGNLIKTFDFNYLVNTNRKFLSSINLNNQVYYSFDYYLENVQLPPTFTKGIDHWGFWNGQPLNQYLVPQCLQNSNGDLTNNLGQIGYYQGQNREPNAGLCKFGMLKKVTHSTKGYTEFEYEGHDYSKRLERRSDNAFLPKLYSFTGVAGGARIKKITDFDGIKYIYREFEYKKDDLSSSGILLDFPRYFFHMKANVTAQDNLYKWRSTSYNSNCLDGNYITYSKVTEIKSDGSKIEKSFSNYETNPDLDDANSIKTFQLTAVKDSSFNPSQLTSTIPNLYKNFVGVQLSDQSIERGKLTKEIVKNHLNESLVETTYTYNLNPNKYNKFIPNMKATGGGWIQSYKIYTYPNYLTQKKTKEYFNGSFVENITNYTYNGLHNYPIVVSTSCSNTDESQETRFTYPPDDSSSLAYGTNRVAEPIKIQGWKNGSKISESKTVYAFLGGSSVYNYSFLTPYYFYKSKGLNQNELFLTQDHYDAWNFNVNQTKNYQTGKTTSYIWGYNRLLLIAKIENLVYQGSVYSYVNNLETLSDTGTEAELITALDNLRAAFPNAMVTTYTHKPLIGVSTITDPRGDRITYEYDTFCRLKAVRDKDNNILSENEYHYKQP